MTSIKYYEFKARCKKDAEFQFLQEISFHLGVVWLLG